MTSVVMDESPLFVNLQDTVNVNDARSPLWVFGYGSLCWNPGFEFKKTIRGYIKGYSRKFWQGNNTHRGTNEKPGRVATLVKDDDKSIVHGVAFEISDSLALEYLKKRECHLGGYVTEFATFYPALEGLTLRVILYIATSENALWMGDAPLYDIAHQITYAKGTSGYNAEYLLRLANFMRKYFPGENDEHLFALERLVKINFKDEDLFVKIESNFTNFLVKNQTQNGMHLANYLQI